MIASHNAGKVREIAALLAPFGTEVISAGALGLDEPVEDGATFIANAEIKARAAARAARLPALADDSGLMVPALGGEPGIHSARWAGPEKDFDMAMTEVWRRLAGGDPKAHFACALSLCWPETEATPEHIETFEGAVHGNLVWPPRGTEGFGYDPMFVADGYSATFGEIDPDEKHRISHRAAAFRLLVEACFA
ncbi:MAG: non-canonical purine NTP pyrophosphatase [Rhodospirillaceae bacterium]